MIGKRIIEFESIDSTNSYIKSNIEKLDSGTIVSADYQTSGYGRMKRVWFDNKGKNLAFSVLLKLNDTKNITLLTQVAAASIIDTLKKYGLEAQVKWPNDILINHKKICGILLETILNGNDSSVILGIGLNVNTESFDSMIINKATSMFIDGNTKYKRKDVLNKIIDNLNKYYCSFLNNKLDYLNVCRRHSYVIGKYVYLDTDSSKKALVKGIDDLGRLIVDIHGEEVTFYGSEVSLSSIYKT